MSIGWTLFDVAMCAAGGALAGAAIDAPRGRLLPVLVGAGAGVVVGGLSAFAIDSAEKRGELLVKASGGGLLVKQQQTQADKSQAAADASQAERDAERDNMKRILDAMHGEVTSA